MYFEIDNTPEVGRVNTFICHVSNGKGLVHFINADIFPNPIKINNDKKNKTNCYVIKAFVKRTIDVIKDDDTNNKHVGFEIDQESIEAFPIKTRELTQKPIVFFKEPSFKMSGYHFSKQVQGILRKAILKLLTVEPDIHDCCKEITKEEYDQYLIDLAMKKRIEQVKNYNESTLKRLSVVGLDFKDLEPYKKYYSKAQNLFFVQKKHLLQPYSIAFLDFDSFYDACDGDISNADLYEYDFNGIDGTKYDFGSAIINSSAKKDLGLYTKDKIIKLIHDSSEKVAIMPSISEDLVPTRMKYGVIETYPSYEESDNVFLYISDLHINHKLINSNIDRLDDSKIDRYFEKIVLSLEKTIPSTRSFNKSIFIIGDVSFDYEMFQRFFRIYSKHIFIKTFFVLGNHELWDRKLCQKYTYFDDMVNEFRTYLNTLGITLLENELYIPSLYCHVDELKHIYSYKEILNLDNETILKMFDANSYVILGGMGFAGLNKDFNSLNGIYRNAPIDRKIETTRSHQLSEIHKRLREVVPNKKILVVTHMPPTDWCSDVLCPNWYYLYGHTHKNSYLESDELTYYADNQIGYRNTSFGFKFFSTSSRFNIFSDFSDGIHEITREQYALFYYGIGDSSYINRDFYKLLLLKNSPTMMFLMQKKEGGPFFIVNGGNIKKTNGESPEYFYSMMNNYAQSIKLFLNDYLSRQKRLASEVKKIGGTGTIHGAIVDIDFFNHIYLNPLDGSIVPYFAWSMTNKTVYKNIPSLLKHKTPAIYNNYLKLIGNDGKNSLVVLKDSQIYSETIFVPETSMYRVSRLIKGLQYTTEFNIIRLWNYSIAEKPSKENGKTLVTGIINPNEIQELSTSYDKKK